MKAPSTGAAALAALAVILGVTALWWILALWPGEAPSWWLRTREVCFGRTATGLPTAGGWLLLVGEPIGLLGTLVAIAGRELRVGLRRVGASATGRLVVAVVLGGVLLGAGAAAVRVRSALAPPIPAIGGGVVRVDIAAPPLELVDQYGVTRRLADLRGRPVLVSFAFAHCETVCPGLIRGLLDARREFPETAAFIVTVDPWRDVPSRLPSIARQWDLEDGEFVLGGAVDRVRAVHAAWGIEANPDPSTGAVAHPPTIVVIGRDGRIKALVTGDERERLRRSVREVAWDG
jgi:cytochrome oxidase Cu insertion factor (SCO1/SenC/PrrC family)